MPDLNPVYRERLFALIDDAPFVRHMGMRITDIAVGRATFEMTAAPFRLQPFNVIHGGNIATLIDSATFWACFLSMGSDDDGLTSIDLKLNYLAPARVEALRCTGNLIKEGKRLSYAEAEVRGEDGRLVAHGTSTLMRLPGLGVKLGIPLWAGG
ncbi:MAG TPA: PaaI family thioesterase [Polyangia bacterium]|nr:PaaI family thioesterase [Polyangia bacterium]